MATEAAEGVHGWGAGKRLYSALINFRVDNSWSVCFPSGLGVLRDSASSSVQQIHRDTTVPCKRGLPFQGKTMNMDINKKANKIIPESYMCYQEYQGLLCCGG